MKNVHQPIFALPNPAQLFVRCFVANCPCYYFQAEAFLFAHCYEHVSFHSFAVQPTPTVYRRFAVVRELRFLLLARVPYYRLLLQEHYRRSLP